MPWANKRSLGSSAGAWGFVDVQSSLSPWAQAVNTRLMRPLKLCFLPLLAISLVHCNNPMLIVDVDIDYWPSEAKTLLLVTTLNGQPGKEQRLSPDERRLAIHLPADASGTVAVRVYGMDAGDCIKAEGSLEASVPTSLNRTEQHSIKMTRPSKPKCSFTALSTTLSTVPSLTSVWGSDVDNVYVVGGGGADASAETILRCSSSSEPCNLLNLGRPGTKNFANKAVWGSDAHNVFVVSEASRIRRCSVGESQCLELSAPMSLPAFASVWGSDPQNVYAVGQGTIVRCAGSTGTCSQLTSTATNWLNRVWGSDSEYVYAVGGDAYFCGPGTLSEIVRCRATSSDCEKLSVPSDSSLCGVWGSDAGNVYAVGGKGAIVRCTAATNRCTKLNSGTTQLLYSVWGSDAGNVYVVGDNTIVRCRAGSDTCTSLNPGTVSVFRAVWGSDARNVYVVGTGGVVVRCAAGEEQCTPLTTNVKTELRAVFGIDSNNVYVVGESGTILRRRL